MHVTRRAVACADSYHAAQHAASPALSSWSVNSIEAQEEHVQQTSSSAASGSVHQR
eukprot:CAMPEP_0119389730 /NCGR_PEP_ID=MMETSP1334-20130426/110622_1 /TAXON_ID=127549 /ORGANISM="Calcidiscus leptoporus, Strain RCC1130" /LENGTH=55 /DNA_ID=CAMNT_0007412055 /DNA_START=128 /DNA_END=291 /DNA_ORIENTATION=+